MNLSPEAFDELVADALDTVPTVMLDMLDNVAFFVEDEPEPGAVGEDGGELLGVYEGVALPDRHDWGSAAWLPDRIVLYRGPHLRRCPDLSSLRREITVTIVHEMAHHLGVDEDRLHELGWG